MVLKDHLLCCSLCLQLFLEWLGHLGRRWTWQTEEYLHWVIDEPLQSSKGAYHQNSGTKAFPETWQRKDKPMNECESEKQAHALIRYIPSLLKLWGSLYARVLCVSPWSSQTLHSISQEEISSIGQATHTHLLYYTTHPTLILIHPVYSCHCCKDHSFNGHFTCTH